MHPHFLPLPVRRVFALVAIFVVVGCAAAQGSWESRDIGAVSIAGSSTATASGAEVVGSGADIWGFSDECHFRYQAITGDGQLVARVASIGLTNDWAKAGVMVRETLAPDARNVFMLATAVADTAFQYRGATGGETAFNEINWRSGMPVWLKVVRSADLFTGYWSLDGVAWTQAGGVTLSGAAATMYVGLAVTSHNDGVACRAVFDNVALLTGGGAAGGGAPVITSATTASATIGVPFQYTITATNSPTRFDAVPLPSGLSINQDTGVISGTPSEQSEGPYTVNISAENNLGRTWGTLTVNLSRGWRSQDIGTVAAAGSSAEAGDVTTVRGSGADVWDTQDEFHFRYQPVDGDFQLVARLTSLSNTHPWAKAGLMMRDGVGPGARNVFVGTSSQNGASEQFRFYADDTTSMNALSWSTTLPIWLKILRTQNNFICYTSLDGVSWNVAAQGAFSIPYSMNVGFAVTSHNDGVVCEATFDHIVLTRYVSTPPSAPTNLTASAVSPTQVNLSWTNTSAGEMLFEVERSIDGMTFNRIYAANVTSYQDMHALAGTTQYYRVRARNTYGASDYTAVVAVTTPTDPSPDSSWDYRDIGRVGISGMNSSSGNTITISGSGRDIWDSEDGFRFVYKPMRGDVTVEAQISRLTPTHPWAKAGVMIRGELTAESPNVFACITPDTVVGGQIRTAPYGSTQLTAGTWHGMPYWVRLVRTGSRITASYSADAMAWTQFATYDASLPDDVYVGFAVTSHDNSQLATAVFTDPSVR